MSNDLPDSKAFWHNWRVCVTGGAGFLGSYVVRSFDCAQERERGCGEVFVPRSKDYDLTQLPAVQKLYGDSRPDIVIHPSTEFTLSTFALLSINSANVLRVFELRGLTSGRTVSTRRSSSELALTVRLSLTVPKGQSFGTPVGRRIGLMTPAPLQGRRPRGTCGLRVAV